jgi:hypothetical protein
MCGQIVSPEERALFVESVLDRPQRLRLVVNMRGNFRALMGNPTGHYSLDLANAKDRWTAIRLGEAANLSRRLAGKHKCAIASPQFIRHLTVCVCMCVYAYKGSLVNSFFYRWIVISINSL